MKLLIIPFALIAVCISAYATGNSVFPKAPFEHPSGWQQIDGRILPNSADANLPNGQYTFMSPISSYDGFKVGVDSRPATYARVWTETLMGLDIYQGIPRYTGIRWLMEFRCLHNQFRIIGWETYLLELVGTRVSKSGAVQHSTTAFEINSTLGFLPINSTQAKNYETACKF
jgi:hypothetical protein